MTKKSTENHLLDAPKLSLQQNLIGASEWLRQLAEDLATGKAEEVSERQVSCGFFRHFTFKKIKATFFDDGTEIVEGPSAIECTHHLSQWLIGVQVAECVKEEKRYVFSFKARKD